MQIMTYVFVSEGEQDRESKQEAQEGDGKHGVTRWPWF